MIEAIHLLKAASYGDVVQSMTGLKKFTYIFGTNGSGKTTISRLFANPAEPKFTHCKVSWALQTPLQTLVYNRDFVQENFSQSEIRGVFTLGKQSIEEKNALEVATAELARISSDLQTLQNTLSGADGLGGKRAERASLDAHLRERCWALKVKYDKIFSSAFEGYRNDKTKFAAKVLEESKKSRKKEDILESLDMLEKKAQTVFVAAPATEVPLQLKGADELVDYESSQILSKIVVGSKDVDIADLIDRIGGSDWVKQGVPLLAKSDGYCPFCQQEVPQTLSRDLHEYFDRTFVEDSDKIDALKRAYAISSREYLESVDMLLTSSSTRFDKDELRSFKDLAATKIGANLVLLDIKQKEPSRAVVLEGLADVVQSISKLVVDANREISIHNEMIANIRAERSLLIAQVWRHLTERELAAELISYSTKWSGLDQAIRNIEIQLTEGRAKRTEKEAQISLLERSSTSVQPTVDAINSLLGTYGFVGFSLVKVGGANTYALKRPDATDARETLSEGEKSFVTFLYFYFLLRGSVADAGTVSPRIAVLDDPVSSLDSNVLFIVSNLIQQLMADVRAGVSPVRQVIILTHNIHFHKEVTFNPDRRSAVLRDESFWVVRKVDGVSRLESCSSNPVSSSYEMLWAELRSENTSPTSIQNTMRRVLESYFRFFGNIDIRSLETYFEGQDKIVCRSLLSWVNAGSHGFDEALHFSVGTESVESYRRIFESIFKASNHGAHYRMMMRQPEVTQEEALAG